ncbi:MAG: DUF1778 domain-containing protein [Bauldia sp.]
MKKRKNRTLEGARQALAMAKGELDGAAVHVFDLDADQWAAFTRALDKPPAPNEKLRRLMARKPPWEK